MDIILGLCAASVTVLIFCAAFGAHRRVVPARWTQIPGLSMLTCVTLTMLTPLSIGLFVRAAMSPAYEIASFNWESAMVAAAVLAMTVVLAPILIRPARHSRAVVVSDPA